MSEPDWVRGDVLGHLLPVHGEALRAAGADYLTRAFRAAGSLGADNSVTNIAGFEEWAGGSTGRKFRFAVTYERPDPSLPRLLFAKFSRDLNDPIRDRGKTQMESEVRFGLVSRIPGFPISVPRCLFADYHLESGTGVLITERIEFGTGAIEPHIPKARDFEMQDMHGHYDALIIAIARLAGFSETDRFPAEIMAQFADDPFKTQQQAWPSCSPEQMRGNVERYAEFAERYPQLLPAEVRTESFIERLADQTARFAEHRDAINTVLAAGPEMKAFCHWNANVDNAWFWRNENGRLECGLMDWGNVGRIDIVGAISSCLMFAEPDFVIGNLDRLLTLFNTVYEQCGARALDVSAMKYRYILRMASSSPSWVLSGSPKLIERKISAFSDIRDRFDPRILDDEGVRTQLHMLRGLLLFWKTWDMDALLNTALRDHASLAGPVRSTP